MADVQPPQRMGGSNHDSSSGVDEVVEYLQLAGRRYLEHVELLRQEQQVREAQRAPFRPAISAYAEQVSKTSVVRQGSSIGDRLHELHQRKLALLAEEAAEEEKRRLAQEKSVCTFAPTITTKAERSTRVEGDVSVSLHRWDEQRRARQVRRQVEATKDELSAVTGVPRISAYAEEKARAERQRRAIPIEESLLADAEARRQRQQAAFEQRHSTNTATTSRAQGARVAASWPISSPARSSGDSPTPRFVPAISSYASRIRFEQGVVDRLYSHHRTQQQQQQQQGGSGVYDEEMQLHCTFHPQLSELSTVLSQRYHEAGGETDVDPHSRLYRNTHHPSKYRKSMVPDTGSGRPEISEASRRIVEERRRELALAGDPAALVDCPGTRLYQGHRPNTATTTSTTNVLLKPTFKKKVMTERDIEMQTALTFAPVVSSTSNTLWRQRVTALKATGVARNEEEARQLLWRKAEKKREESITRQQAQRRREEAEACSFRPTTGRPPHRRSGYTALPIEARTNLWARQREARLSELRHESEGSTLEECSFHPHVDPVFPLPRPDARLATGVEAFVERQAEARRRREEAKEWWRPQYVRKSGRAALNTTCTTTAAASRTRSTASASPSTSPRSEQRSTTPQRAGSRSRSNVATTSERGAKAATYSGNGAGSRSPLQRSATSTSTLHHHEEEEEVFVQHWAGQPPSTSLTASSFSHASQADVPSAESSPRQLAYVVHQPPAAAFATGRREASEAAAADTSTGPYRWQPTAAAATMTTPTWRKPLRFHSQ
jgi:hypothetical protein